jgi:hypothetical protein
MRTKPSSGFVLIVLSSIPISTHRPIEVGLPPFAFTSFLFTIEQDNYLDAYLRVIKTTEPLRTAVVFSSGAGAIRTTFAMVAALIIRRKQLIEKGLDDPYVSRAIGTGTPVSTGTATVSMFSRCGHWY